MELPEDFQKKYRQLLKQQAPAFLNAFAQNPVSAFRIEPQRWHSDLSNYAAIPGINQGYYGKLSGKQIEFLAGAFYSQEPSAMYVAQVLAPKPEDFVLDLCAAPGGKTTFLASQMQNQGWLLANEIDLKRAKILTENVGRMGYQNVAVSNDSPETLAAKFPSVFSKILVDAPCSGEGMFRKDPQAMQYWSLSYPQACAKKQRRILANALKMLSPGGVLVYSTCTFSPEENEGVISAVLKDNPDLSLAIIPNPPAGVSWGEPRFGDNNPELRKCLRFYPHQFKGEGQFIAKLQKAGTPLSIKARKKVPNSPVASEFKQFVKLTLREKPQNVFAIADQYYALDPYFYQEIQKLHLVKRGIKVGTLKKKRFVPHQELFQALPVAAINHVIALDDDQFRTYCHGDELKIAPSLQTKNWVALTNHDYLFGFGHLVQDRLKNFYPKSLRN